MTGGENDATVKRHELWAGDGVLSITKLSQRRWKDPLGNPTNKLEGIASWQRAR